jgi:hypothetical protein
VCAAWCRFGLVPRTPFGRAANRCHWLMEERDDVERLAAFKRRLNELWLQVGNPD